MKQMAGSPRRSEAGWLTALIQRARGQGLDNRAIAAALEDSIEIRPLTIGRDDWDRLVGTMADAAVTLDDLFDSPGDRPRIR